MAINFHKHIDIEDMMYNDVYDSKNQVTLTFSLNIHTAKRGGILLVNRETACGFGLMMLTMTSAILILPLAPEVVGKKMEAIMTETL